MTQLSDKFAKVSEKLTQTEAARKTISEKLKEEERSSKETMKELISLRERNEVLSRENTELRRERAVKERSLMDRLKRAEKELGRTTPAEGRVSWDEEARDIIDREWEQFRAQER